VATFKPDDKFWLRNMSTGEVIPGEFSAIAAKTRGVALSIETGDYIECFVVGGPRDESVAAAMDGQWMLHQPHDDEGNSLPFPLWPGHAAR
jgi:hypothetical protein